MKKTMKKLLVLAWGLLAAGPIFSKVKLPSVLGSNMVLQRECDANLWASPHRRFSTGAKLFTTGSMPLPAI